MTRLVRPETPATVVASYGKLSVWLLDLHLIIADFSRRIFRLYNPQAAALWLLIDESEALQVDLVAAYRAVFNLSQDVAARDVANCIDDWRTLGWLSVNPLGRICVTAPNEPVAPAKVREGVLGQTGQRMIFRRVLQFGDVQFGLSVGETTLTAHSSSARIVEMFQGFPQADTSDAERWLQIVVGPESIWLDEGAGLISTGADPAVSANAIFLAIFRLAYPQKILAATLHAAAVGLQRTLILPGVSGAGKSTLAAYLAASRWHYYGDDIVGLANTGEVLPLPTAVGLKEGSWAMLEKKYPGLSGRDTIVYGSKFARYLPVAFRFPKEANALALAAWVFPEYAADAELRVDAISTLDAIERLARSTMALAVGADHHSMTGILDALTRLPKYRLIYADLDKAEACLRRLATN